MAVIWSPGKGRMQGLEGLDAREKRSSPPLSLVVVEGLRQSSPVLSETSSEVGEKRFERLQSPVSSAISVASCKAWHLSAVPGPLAPLLNASVPSLPLHLCTRQTTAVRAIDSSLLAAVFAVVQSRRPSFPASPVVLWLAGRLEEKREGRKQSSVVGASPPKSNGLLLGEKELAMPKMAKAPLHCGTNYLWTLPGNIGPLLSPA